MNPEDMQRVLEMLQSDYVVKVGALLVMHPHVSGLSHCIWVWQCHVGWRKALL